MAAIPDRRAVIGGLRRRLTLQEEGRVADGGGGFTLVWQNVAANPTVWGRIVPLSGREVLQAGQLQTPVSHRILIRYRPDVTGAMRLVLGTRVFNIRAAVNVDGRDRWLELMCEEGVAT
jgi:SPP1 family predicted phage head-tail adaptor